MLCIHKIAPFSHLFAKCNCVYICMRVTFPFDTISIAKFNQWTASHSYPISFISKKHSLKTAATLHPLWVNMNLKDTSSTVFA